MHANFINGKRFTQASERNSAQFASMKPPKAGAIAAKHLRAHFPQIANPEQTNKIIFKVILRNIAEYGNGIFVKVWMQIEFTYMP